MPMVQPAPFDLAQRSTVRSLLFSQLRLEAGDRLVVVFGPPYATEAAWLGAQARTRGVNARLLGAAGWGTRLLGTRVLGALPELRGTSTAPDSGREVALFLGGEPLDQAVLGLPPRLAAVQLPASGGALDGWEDPRAQPDRIAALLARTESGPALLVRTAQTSTLRLVRDPAAPVRVDRGEPRPGVLRVLPAGHVEPRLVTVDGEFIANRTVRTNRVTRLGTSLAHRPVRLEIADGRVVRTSCPDEALGGFLARAVEVHGMDLVRSAQCRPTAGRPEVVLRLAVGPGRPYSTASADLCVDLGATASWDTEQN